MADHSSIAVNSPALSRRLTHANDFFHLNKILPNLPNFQDFLPHLRISKISDFLINSCFGKKGVAKFPYFPNFPEKNSEKSNFREKFP